MLQEIFSIDWSGYQMEGLHFANLVIKFIEKLGSLKLNNVLLRIERDNVKRWLETVAQHENFLFLKITDRVFSRNITECMKKLLQELEAQDSSSETDRWNRWRKILDAGNALQRIKAYHKGLQNLLNDKLKMDQINVQGAGNIDSNHALIDSICAEKKVIGNDALSRQLETIRRGAMNAYENNYRVDKCFTDAIAKGTEMLFHECQSHLSDIKPSMIKIGEMIGKGSFGIVYRGELIIKEGEAPFAVACKTPHQEHKYDVNAKSAFLQEAATWHRLNHPYIARMFGTTELNGKWYIIMELGTATIYDMYTKVGQHIPNGDLKRFTMQILLALQYIHDVHYMVHQDISSKNVIVCGSVVKLIDFGLAAFRQESSVQISQTEKFGGSIQYMAPELIAAIGNAFESVVKRTAAADIYSFGKLVSEMVYCKQPNEALATSQANSPRIEIDVAACDSPDLDILKKMISRCCNDDPRERPTAGTLLEFYTSTDGKSLMDVTKHGHCESGNSANGIPRNTNMDMIPRTDVENQRNKKRNCSKQNCIKMLLLLVTLLGVTALGILLWLCREVHVGNSGCNDTSGCNECGDKCYNYFNECYQFNGLRDQNVCCPISCGKCGGDGCGSRPGGNKNCCTQNIATQNRICGSNVSAPCSLKNVAYDTL